MTVSGHWRASLRRLLLLALPLAFGYAAARTVRETARVDRTVADESKTHERVVTRELAPNGVLRFGVDPGTDVLRLVLHAFRRGELDDGRATAKVTVVAEGPMSARRETLVLTLPAGSGRARAELGDAAVGDPLSLSLDVQGSGGGTLSITLESLAGAEGLLVRAYRRERGDTEGPLEHAGHVGSDERLHLAHQAGVLDWIDLEPSDRAALLRTRWHKLAPLASSSGADRDRTLLLAPREDGSALSAVKASAPSAAEPAATPAADSPVTYYRSSVDRAVVVAATAGPLLLRVVARRPAPRSDRSRSEVVLIASLSREHGGTVTDALRAELDPSSPDHYEVPPDDREPSSKVVWHFLVPARGRLVLRPAQGELDLSLAELDPEAPPRTLEPLPLATEPAETPAKTPHPWGGFVARRPTNAEAFEPRFVGTLRVAPVAGTRTTAEPNWQTPRVARPPSAEAIRREGTVFDPGSLVFPVVVTSGSAALLPLRLFTTTPTTVRISIDGGAPRRKALGVAERVTTARSLAVTGETHALLVLGDDLLPGTHELSFTTEPEVPVWVHLPWSRHEHVARSAWLAGDFSP